MLGRIDADKLVFNLVSKQLICPAVTSAGQLKAVCSV